MIYLCNQRQVFYNSWEIKNPAMAGFSFGFQCGLIFLLIIFVGGTPIVAVLKLVYFKILSADKFFFF